MCSLKLAVVYAIQLLLLLLLLLVVVVVVVGVVVMMMMMILVFITVLFSTCTSNQHAQSTRSRVRSKIKKKASLLFYIDDLKLFSGDETKLQQELIILKTFSDDIKMEFGLVKCVTAIFKHGR
jgi:flagellar basal body-associated protein FliL